MLHSCLFNNTDPILTLLLLLFLVWLLAFFEVKYQLYDSWNSPNPPSHPSENPVHKPKKTQQNNKKCKNYILSTNKVSSRKWKRAALLPPCSPLSKNTYTNLLCSVISTSFALVSWYLQHLGNMLHSFPLMTFRSHRPMFPNQCSALNLSAQTHFLHSFSLYFT